MKKVFTIIYSILASLVFAGAIGFFAYNIVDEYNHSELRIQKRIDTVKNSILTIPDYKLPGTEEYTNELLKIIGLLDDFAFLKIDVNEKNLYSYPSNAIFTNTNTKLINSREINLTKGNNTYRIQSSLYLIRPVSIFKYARLTFLIILAATIVTIIFILLSNLFSSNKSETKTYVVNPKKNKVDYVEPAEDEHIDHCEDNNIAEKSEVITEEPVVFEEETPAMDETTTTEETAAEETSPIKATDIESETLKPVEPVAAPIPEEKEDEPTLPAEESKPMEMTNTDPAGLFSPVTGFGWQSYLETRLTNELHRATASEFDLSLFIIKIPVLLNCSDKLLGIICRIIETHFQFRDLIFEYSDDCFAGMKINMSVDEAIIFADKLVADLKSILPEDNNDCFIGISSRSIRIVNSRTITHEAQEALNYAVEGNTAPVIAFRADAAKYRRYSELD